MQLRHTRGAGMRVRLLVAARDASTNMARLSYNLHSTPDAMNLVPTIEIFSFTCVVNRVAWFV